MGDVILFIGDFASNSSISICRICHEEESASFKGLEVPCACSGTVKFAHRYCIQKWCNEKGNTTCEICLQEYEPGYTATVSSKKSQVTEAGVTVRYSLAITEVEEDQQRLVALAEEMNIENELSQCTSAADRGASRCRSLALAFIVVLLVKHIFAVLNGETDHYPFGILTILFSRASGIILPMYILIRIITVVQNSIRRQRRQSYEYGPNSDEYDADQ